MKSRKGIGGRPRKTAQGGVARLDKPVIEKIKGLAEAIYADSRTAKRKPSISETVSMLLDHYGDATRVAVARSDQLGRVMELAESLRVHNGELLAKLKSELQDKQASQYALRTACLHLTLYAAAYAEKVGDAPDLRAVFDSMDQDELRNLRSRWISFMLEKGGQGALDEARGSDDEATEDWKFEIHQRAVEIASLLERERERVAG